MKKDLGIWYEPHPVSAARKAELNAQGYKIIDAVFMPAGHSQEEADVPSSTGEMTKAELQDALTAEGIDYKASMPKAELQALLDAA